LHTKLLPEDIALLRGTKNEKEYACEALGFLSENLENVKERIDPRLTPGSPCNVEIQGIPIACDTMELADLLHRFDGGIVPANLARITRILPPLQHVWPKDSREPVITKTAKLENFHVSPSLFSFLKTAGRHSDLPVDLFLQDDSPFVHAVEIPVTAELRGFIKLLELLNWSKWQIEGYLRKLVESAILRSGENVSVVGLRMLVIKQATSSAAGGRRVPCRHLCSEGRIVVLLDDAPSVAALAQRLRGLTIELHPLPNITVSFTPWQHSQVTKSLTSIWMIKKEAEARLKASECVPPRPILSRVEVRFKVIVNPMADIRKSLESMEQIFLHALGNTDLGIVAVQLFADSCGRVNPQCRGYIWVCDLDDGERHLCKDLVDRLKGGEAAIFTNTLSSIGCSGTPAICDCEAPNVTKLTQETTAKIIMRSLRNYRGIGLILTSKLANGHPLPLQSVGGHPETTLASLGPTHNTIVNSEARDIRDLFPDSSPQPSVNVLCAALNVLVESRVVNSYAEVLEDREVTVFRAATSDDWLADEMSA